MKPIHMESEPFTRVGNGSITVIASAGVGDMMKGDAENARKANVRLGFAAKNIGYTKCRGGKCRTEKCGKGSI